MTGDGPKRLFTLSGVVPAAAFLVEHLVVTGSAMGGGGRFDRVVGPLVRSSIFTIFELVFVLIPLAYHTIYGIYLTGKPRDPGHFYASDNLHRMQRFSGVLVLLFLGVHLWEFRLQRAFYGLDSEGLYTRLVELLSWTAFGVPWIALFTLVGVGASVFHLMNGLWAFRTSTQLERPSSARSGAFVAFGVVLFLLGSATVISVAIGNRLLPAAEPGMAPCGLSPPATTASPAPSR